MKTLTRIETGKDARGNKYQTTTYQDFAEMTPTSGVTSWTLTQEDGVYTLIETITEEVPEPGGGGGNVFPDIWSLDVSTVSEPIETNIYFASGMSAVEMAQWTQWKAGREAGADTFPTGFPKNSSNEVVIKLYQRFNRGEVEYLTPRIVLKHQKVYSVPPALTGVGFASNDVAGNPFTFSNTVNFLMTGATSVQEGNLYRVTREWLTSRPGKWDTLLYGGGN